MCGRGGFRRVAFAVARLPSIESARMAHDPARPEHAEPKVLCLTREVIKRANGVLKGMWNGEIRIIVQQGRICRVRRVQDFECEDTTIED